MSYPGQQGVTTSTNGTDMIEVHELTKRYGGTTAARGLSFTVHSGRVTSFLAHCVRTLRAG
jgi:hypothetical protein